MNSHISLSQLLDFEQKQNKLHTLYIYLKLFKKVPAVVKDVFFQCRKMYFFKKSNNTNCTTIMLGLIDMLVVESLG
jgi:hypothetical protein